MDIIIINYFILIHYNNFKIFIKNIYIFLYFLSIIQFNMKSLNQKKKIFKKFIYYFFFFFFIIIILYIFITILLLYYIIVLFLFLFLFFFYFSILIFYSIYIYNY